MGAWKESERRSRTIINASPVPLAVNNEHGQITLLNDAFLKTLGYTLQDIPTLEDWWPRAYPDPQYRQWVMDTWQQHLEESRRTGQPFAPIEIAVRCKDDAVRTFVVTARPLEEGYAGEHLVSLYDITDRKREEQALIEAKDNSHGPGEGMQQALDGQDKLSQGASLLSNNIRTLAFGVRDLRQGMRSMTSSLPEDQQLDQLRTGSADVAQGAQQLHEGLHRLSQGVRFLSAGLELMAKEVPRTVGALDGSAQGLAHSVNPILEVVAPVDNHGSGLAPNIMAAALWLGASVAAFLIHVRGLPSVAKDFSRLAQVLGKLAMPSCMAFMCSARSALRSSGVLAFIIFSCISRMAFIWMSMAAIDSAALAGALGATALVAFFAGSAG